MEEYAKSIKQRIDVLKKAIKTAEKDVSRFPEGRMRVSQTANQVRYYHVKSNDDHSGTYITSANRDLVKLLAQKDYNKRFLRESRAELTILENALHVLHKENADMVYNNLDPRRKRLVVPYIITDEIYEKQWRAQTYKENPYMPEAKIYDTRNGEKVRSKTEAILADMFFESGIPYRYEQALILQNNTVRYPDFTLLKTRTREEIYLEHFGLLDDEEYREKCMHKLDEYRNSGIFPGKNLLITYESNSYPFDINGTRKMIREIFQLV